MEHAVAQVRRAGLAPAARPMPGAALAPLARLGLARPRRRPAPTPLPPVAPEAAEFQDALEALIAEPPPPLLRGPHHLVALLLVLLLVIAAIAPLDIVVTGQGRLTADAPPVVLQPMERAVLREIRVRPGDLVRQGEPLALLDTTFAEADRAALAGQLRGLRAQLSRAEAEAAERPFEPGPAADPDLLLQAVLHAQRRALHAARLRGFEEEIRGLEAALRTVEGAALLLAEQAGVAREVETLRARLLEGQVGSRLQYLGARAALLQAEQELRTSRNRAEELQHALRAKRAERETFLEDWRRQALEELARLRSETARVEEALAKATRLAELTTIAAPQDGIVLEVARRSAGSVLREAEPLVTLVPAGVPLIAEITLRSADVGATQPGQAVVLKVDAFPYQRFGLLHGRLRAVSPESFAPQAAHQPDAAPSAGPGAVHRGQVELDAGGLPGLPEGARLIPGMTVTAEVMVGSRRLLAFFLDPLLRGMAESLREP